MSKIVLVETISMFRHCYAIELNDDDPSEYALDEVVHYATGGHSELIEFAQKSIGENILSHRVISQSEYFQIFDTENDYLASWPDDKKLEFIYKEPK